MRNDVRSSLVILALLLMNFSIYFDDEPMLRAEKVSDEDVNICLSSPLHSFKFSIAQLLPQNALGWSHVSPECPFELQFLKTMKSRGIAHGSQNSTIVLCPHPTTPSRLPKTRAPSSPSHTKNKHISLTMERRLGGEGTSSIRCS